MEILEWTERGRSAVSVLDVDLSWAVAFEYVFEQSFDLPDRDRVAVVGDLPRNVEKFVPQTARESSVSALLFKDRRMVQALRKQMERPKDAHL